MSVHQRDRERERERERERLCVCVSESERDGSWGGETISSRYIKLSRWR